MKSYVKPEIELIETVLDDVIAISTSEEVHSFAKGADEVW